MTMLNREAVFRLKYIVIPGLFFFLTMTLLTVFSCAKFDKSREKSLLTVGNRIIGEDELKIEFLKAAHEMGIPRDSIKNYLDHLLQIIIDFYLILEYGESNGIRLTEDEFITAVNELEGDYPENEFEEMLLRKFIDYDQWKDEFRKQLLIRKIISSTLKDISPVTGNDIKHYFNTHQEEFSHDERLNVRQIVTSTRKEAENTLSRLKKGQNWDNLAAEMSIAPEAKEGGLIGWVSRGVLEESMEEIIFSLPPGPPSAVIKTPYGFHIFEVLEKMPAGVKSLPQVMGEIETKLSQAKRDTLYQEWLQDLRQKLTVKVNHKVIKTLEFD